MDFKTIVDAIATLGFPIIMCGALYYDLLKQRSTYNKQIDSFRECLNKNTDALKELGQTIKLLSNEER